MTDLLEFPTLNSNHTIRLVPGCKLAFHVEIEKYTVQHGGAWVSGIDVSVTEGPLHKPINRWEATFESMFGAEVFVGDVIFARVKEMGDEPY